MILHFVSKRRRYDLRCLYYTACLSVQQQPAKAVPASSRRHNRPSSSNGEPTHGRGRRHPLLEELVVLSRSRRHNRSPYRDSGHWCVKL